MTYLAYSWEVLGVRSLNPDSIPGAETYIECERGPYPGKAVLLFRSDHAAVIMADAGPLTITVKKHTSTDGQNWTIGETLTFNGYYPVSSRVVDGIDSTVVEVTLLDARKFLSEVRVERSFNRISRLSVTNAILNHDDSTLNSSALWTLGEIWNSLLSTAPASTKFALSSAATPSNLIFDCTLAEAVEQILATQGKAYIWNPFTGSASSQAIGAGSVSPITTAIAAKRLLEDYRTEPQTPVEITVEPWQLVIQSAFINQTETVENIASASANTKRVIVKHFELNTTGVAASAEAWYSVQDDPLDQVFQGVVNQPPAGLVSHCKWWYEDGTTRSRFCNRLQLELPWPQPPKMIERGDTHFVFTLTANLGPSGAPATLAYMDGTAIGTATVLDPAGLYAGMLSGESGVCVCQFRRFYITSGKSSSVQILAAEAATNSNSWAGSLESPTVVMPTVVNPLLASSPIALVGSSDIAPGLPIVNPQSYFWRTGATLILLRSQRDGGCYEVIGVSQQTLRVKFRLTADVASGSVTPSATAQAIVPYVDHGYMPSSNISIKDRYYRMHNAKSNDCGIAELNLGDGVWECIACEHVATVLKGTCHSSGFTGTPAEIVVYSNVGLNGRTPSGATVAVKNRYNWASGAPNGKIDYRWDQVAGEYYATQMTCPP